MATWNAETARICSGQSASPPISVSSVLDWSDMPIHQAILADWKSPEILIEGSLNCAKTTVFLDKEINALLKWPGIPILLFRWSQDAVETKLRPAFEELLTIRKITREWDDSKKRFVFPNGSIAYMFGLKAASLLEQYNKIRGLGVARIGGDQIEEMKPQVAGDLRGRLRPNLTATMLGSRFPFQITFVSNSEDDDFWLSKEFPVDNHIKGRTLYQLSVFDNKHLPQESIDSLLRQYPEDHPKHRTMVLGRRGPNVEGVPVFEGLYRKELHWLSTPIDPEMPILESFECGKHNPVWVFGQQRQAGGLCILGGVLGLGLMLEDFLPLLRRYRDQWFPSTQSVKTCVSPMGGNLLASDPRYTLLDILRTQLRIVPIYRETGNAPDVRVAIIENLSSYLRRRNAHGEEAFRINNDEARFLILSKDMERRSPFVHHAFEGGATWDDHFVSVGHKEVRQIREEDKFANVLHCIENIELNFCAGRQTEAEKQDRANRRRVEGRQPLRGLRLTAKNSWMA